MAVIVASTEKKECVKVSEVKTMRSKLLGDCVARETSGFSPISLRLIAYTLIARHRLV